MSKTILLCNEQSANVVSIGRVSQTQLVNILFYLQGVA